MRIFIPRHKRYIQALTRDYTIYKYYFNPWQLKADTYKWFSEGQEVHILEYYKDKLLIFKGCKPAYYNITWSLNEVLSI